MKEDRLRELLDKYYQGISDEQEEEELKAGIADTEISKRYDADREIILHYSQVQEIHSPSSDLAERIIKAVDELDQQGKKVILRRKYLYITSAAAAILIFIGSYFIFFRQKQQYDTYSDPKIAYAETMKVLYEVSVKLNNGTKALKPMTRISDAAETGFNSINRSAGMISGNLQKIKILESVKTTEEASDNIKIKN